MSSVHSIWIVNRFSTFTDYFGSKESFRDKPILDGTIWESFKKFVIRYFDCFGCMTMLEMKNAEKQNMKDARIEYMELDGLNLCKKGCHDLGKKSLESSLESLEEAWSQTRGTER